MNLINIKSPADLKGLSIAELTDLRKRASPYRTSSLCSKKAVQPNGYTALIHQLFSSEWQ